MKNLSRRTLASRANGNLSRGPVTPASLLRSSANSTRHALLAENLVLDEESKDVFAILHQQFIDRLNPSDGVEVCLVEDLASTVWRQRRLVAIETHLFKEAAAKHPEQTYLGRVGGAFSDLCRTPDMHLLDRYESRLHRMFQRSLKNLQLLREIEYTDPSTGELTQLPAKVTGIPDCSAPAPGAVFTPGEHPPAITEIHELPNEPRNEQPLIESAAYPATSEATNTGGGELSQPPAEVASIPDCSAPAPGAVFTPGEHPLATTEIHELPNEPRNEQLPIESATYPTTSTANPETENTEDLPAASTTKIHELPNEPRSVQPTEKSTPYPETFAPNSQPPSPAGKPPKPQPVDPYAGYPRFQLDLNTGNLRRIA